MERNLETQVAKIHLGDPKQTTTYVYVLAEKIDATETEIYVLCELPLFNPAARADCERISEAIGASLKRSYRKTVNDNTFENALAQINEELGKLASMGKTHWVGKLNALVAAKRGHQLSIATVGKITALLYRDDNFTTMSEATAQPTPLKTFESFAIGKLRLKDLLLFSTTQLLNHVSIDRLRQILVSNDLPEAAGTIVEILRDNAGPEVACGTILALQVKPGQGQDEEIDLAPYVAKAPVQATSKQELRKKILALGPNLWTGAKQLAGQGQNLIRRPPTTVNAKKAVGVVNQQFRKATDQLRPEIFRSFSNTKKFFFVSAAILLVALIVSVSVTSYYRRSQNAENELKTSLAELQKLANDADAALIYGDEAKARELLNQVNSQVSQPQLTDLDPEEQSQLETIKKQADELINKLNKVATANVTKVGTLSNANHLINLPTHLATETSRTIISWNKTSSSVQDNALRSSEPIMQSINLGNNRAAIYNGKELLLWNYQSGTLGGAFSTDVPAEGNMTGLAYYPTNRRVYTIDKAGDRVVSFLTSDRAFSQPLASIQNVGDLAGASDLAIDGNIYILIGGSINKYNSGQPQDFRPSLPSPLSGAAQAYTESGYQNIYILDSDNKRVLILNKNGELVATLVSPEFTNLKDFAVDERGKAIFILNDSSLLKVSF